MEERVWVINGEDKHIFYSRTEFDQLLYDRTKDNIEEHKEILGTISENNSNLKEQMKQDNKKIADKLATRNLIEWIFRTIVLILLTFLTLNK